MQGVSMFFFAGGLLTVAYFFYYILKYSILNKNRNGLIFILLFSAFIWALSASPTFFDFIWILFNTIQFIFVLFLVAHMFATIFFYWKRNRYLKSLNTPDPLPSAAVVVAVFNEEDIIEETVQNLLKLEYDKDKLEIIVIDDKSTDGTLDILKKYEGQIRIVERQGPVIKGKPAAFNDLLPTLDAELICVFDCDSLPKPDFLIKGIRHFKDENVALVQGRNIEYNQNTLVSRLVALDLDVIHFSVYFPKPILKGMIMFEGRAAIFRRSTFLKLGGFDVDLPTEDWDYGCRLQVAGYTSVYDHTIKSYEQAPDDFKSYFKQRRRWLSSTVFSMLKNVSGVVKSSKLSFSQKTDYFFTSTYQLWSLTVNFFGLMVYMAYFQGYDVFHEFTLVMFLSVIVLLLIPVWMIERNPKHLLYFPLMYTYYWTFTFIILETVIDHYLLKKKVRYEKTQHFKNETRFNISNTIS